MLKEGKRTYRVLSEEEIKLRKEYHLVFKRGTYVFLWRSKKYPHFCEVFGTNLDKAKKKALQWIEMIESGVNPKQHEKAKSLTLEELFAEALQKKRLRNISPKSIRRYESVANTILYYFNRKKLHLVSAVTDTDIAEYFYDAAHKPIIPNNTRKGLRAIRQDGASPETLKFEKTFLIHVFEYAVSKGIRTNNPVSEVKTYMKHSTDSDVAWRTFYEHEIPALLDASERVRNKNAVFGNCTMREILEFLLLTGLRESELLHLQWQDVLWDETQNGCISVEPKRYVEKLEVPMSHPAFPIFIMAAKGKRQDTPLFTHSELAKIPLNHLPIRRREILENLKREDIQIGNSALTISFPVEWKPKGKSGRIPLTTTARKILDTIAARKGMNGYVFMGRNGGKIQTKLLNILNDTIEEAKLNTTGRKLSLHSTRHTYGFRLRQKGIPIETIKELMRHSDIKDTMRYARYEISMGADAVQVLDVGVGNAV